MSIMSGTVSNVVKLQQLNNKWQQKKNFGNVLSKQERNDRADWTQEQWMIHDFKEENEQNREASKRNGIINKIMAGEKLTPEEEEYLQKNDPAELKEYRDIQTQKKAYEEKLRNCKTKEDVQRLKYNTVNGFLSELKKIDSDPNIPLSAKLDKAQEIVAKTKNINDAEREFIASGQYEQLPDESDENIEKAKEKNEENENNISKEIDAVKKNSDSQNEDVQVTDIIDTTLQDKDIQDIDSQDTNVQDIDLQNKDIQDKNVQNNGIKQDKSVENNSHSMDAIKEIEEIYNKYVHSNEHIDIKVSESINNKKIVGTKVNISV